jgi:hypothetical protein
MRLRGPKAPHSACLALVRSQWYLELGEPWQTTQGENASSEKVAKSQRPPVLWDLYSICHLSLFLFLFILDRRKDK